MRTEAQKLQRYDIRLAVDEHQIGSYVAVAAVGPIATQGMVAEAAGSGVSAESKSNTSLSRVSSRLP
jgi:hypothetical protein